jgi:KTSC domain
MRQFQAESASKTVGWARYDGRILEVDFKHHKTGAKTSTYSYDGTLLLSGENPTAGFPVEVWNEFQAATEKASYFARYIRPRYRGIKIWQAAPAKA